MKQKISKGIHFYTPPEYKDSGKITIIYRALSESEIRSISSLMNEGRKSEAAYRILQIAIKEIESMSGDSLTIDDLPLKLVTDIATEIINTSTVSDEELRKVKTSVALKTDESFSGETWDCNVCKQKNLDKTRNCGFLSKQEQEKYYDPDFKVKVGKDLYTHCPIFDIDVELLSAAIECNNILELGQLPDDGGFLDQTQFFVLASQEVKYKVAEAQEKKMKEMERKSKSRR